MEISWDFVFFNGVYRSFLIFWKFINYCWFYRRDANWNHLYFSSPWDLIHHLEFLFGVCVCVRGRGNMHVLSHPDILTKSRMFSYTICIDMWWYTQWSCRWQRYPWEVPASISRALQTWRRKPTSRTSDSRPLAWPFFDEFLAFEIAIWKCRADHGIAHGITGFWWRIFRRYLRKDGDDWVTNGCASPSW